MEPCRKRQLAWRPTTLIRVEDIMRKEKEKVELILKEKRMNENAESLISYGVGCGIAALGWICDGQDLWTALALFIGCLIGAVRLAYDGVRLYRYIRNG